MAIIYKEEAIGPRNPSQKYIQVNSTGGTIVSEPTPEGLRPMRPGVDVLRQYVPELVEDALTREVMSVDSTDMHFGEYREVADSLLGGTEERQVDLTRDALAEYAKKFDAVYVSSTKNSKELVNRLASEIGGNSTAFPRLDRVPELIPGKGLVLVSGDEMNPKFKGVYSEGFGLQHGYSSQVVVQGTDSMEYSGAFFAFRFPFRDDPIVIVGSMYPLGEEDSDAYRNLQAAMKVAEEGWPGSYVVINDGQVLRATRALKMKPNRVEEDGTTVPVKEAFVSKNYPKREEGSPLAVLRGDSLQYTPDGEEAQQRFLEKTQGRAKFFRERLGEVALFLPQYEKVKVIEMHANVDPDEMTEAYKKGRKAVVIKATGTGGVFTTPKQMAFADRIKKWVDDGRYVAITSKVPLATVDREYEVNRRGTGAVLTGDMTSEAAIAKAELAAGLAETPGDFRKLMLYNFADELNPNILDQEERVTDDELLDIIERAAKRGNGNGRKWLGLGRGISLF